MMLTIEEKMGYAAYSYPVSKVSFDIEKEIDINRTQLVCNDQVWDYQISDNKIFFMTDINAGEKKMFSLIENKNTPNKNLAYYEKDMLILDNNLIKIKIKNDVEEIFEISDGIETFGRCTLSDNIKRKTVSLIDNGSVFANVKIECQLCNDEKYILTLGIVKDLEYVTLTEDILTKNKIMNISWSGFMPTHRKTKGNGFQSCNKYLANEFCDENGYVQHKMVPHDQTHGNEDTTFCSFYNDERCVGAFVADASLWNDGTYTVDGNSHLNAVSFKCNYNHDGCEMVFEYPLNTGTRMTALALYRKRKDEELKLSSYINEMQFYGYWLPLDKVKDWVLDWEDENNKEAPFFFNRKDYDDSKKYTFHNFNKIGVPDAEETVEIIEADNCIKLPWTIGPVSTRTYYAWMAAVDMNYKKFTSQQMKKIKKIASFAAYYCSQENVMPTIHTLAGHPNFLIDFIGVVGMCSAMFPEHPMAKKWKDYYEKCVALFLKFHIRPDVKEWHSQGGRATENTGVYAYACLTHLLSVSLMIKKRYNDSPVLYENLEKLAYWLLNTLSAPVDGKRTVIPSGAHAGARIYCPYYPIYILRVLGDELKNYNPMLSQYILNVCSSDDIYTLPTDNVFGFMAKLNSDNGTLPDLHSEKFTGYGYVLRSHVNTENEMSVTMQQIDDGPNYRWGIMSEGGCGSLFYYANNTMYSGNGTEDIGDDTRRDDEVGCNFSVLDNNQYKSLGRNELINPLIDFGCVQYARMDAGTYSNKKYKYRSVMMVDNRYIVIYDAVKHLNTQGCFNWFNYEDRPLPFIHQLKPGVEGKNVTVSKFTVDMKSANNRSTMPDLKGVRYDGKGDFLTIVSHNENILPNNTYYGAKITDDSKEEYIFNSDAVVRVKENNIEFYGTVGYVKLEGNKTYVALIDGYYVAVGGIVISKKQKDSAVCVECDGTNYYGQVVNNFGEIEITIPQEGYTLYQNDDKRNKNTIDIKNGKISFVKDVPNPQKVMNVSYTEEKNGCKIKWDKVSFAEYYEISLSDNGINNWIYEGDTDNSEYVVKANNSLKRYVRIRACNNSGKGEWSCVNPLVLIKDIPVQIEGLKIKHLCENKFKIVWGKQLGIEKYNLYRIVKGCEPVCIYSNEQNSYIDTFDEECEYYVTAVNGYGESVPSCRRDNFEDGLAYFDPLPDTVFVRDTVNNEYYPGTNYKRNERKVLHYPN